MKKIAMKHLQITFMLTVLMSMVGTKASAHDIAVKNSDGVTIYYNYINDGTELEVVAEGDQYYSGVVNIPETVTYMNKTRRVTSIGKSAFERCEGLTSVEIPNSVTSIGDEAFYKCTKLTSVKIPNSVTRIGWCTFYKCTELTSVEIPNSVTSIGESAFWDCSSLTSVEIPSSVTSIGSNAFDGCYSFKKVIVKDISAWCNIQFGNYKSNPLFYANHLYSDKNTEITDLVIPDSVTSIGESAFENCKGLTSVEIPNSVTSIGSFAFEWCEGLTSVEIPNSVTSIGESAFAYCSGLTTVEIPNSVTSIGKKAFLGCSGLSSVTIGNSVTTIGSSAFNGCSGLTSVEIPNSVTSIGEFAFCDCSGLTSVEIPNSVTSIGEGAFERCSGLTSVEIPNSVTSIGKGAFLNCSGLTKIDVASDNTTYDSRDNCNAIIETVSNTLIVGCQNTIIPNSVTSIGESAFESCEGLTSVEIPNSVTSIGESAFESCEGLTSVEIPNSVTSIGYAAFSSCDISTVTSLIENPFAINSNVFSQDTRMNATLYIPKGTIDKYKATEGWKDFMFIEEGTDGGETPTVQKCEKPTISYKNGKLTFKSATAGAVCQSSITDTDIKSYSGNEIQLGVTYNISVYATKTGYENSETATATLCWIDVEPKTEGIDNGVAQVKSNAVLIQSNDGVVTVSGVDDGKDVAVYSVDGQMVSSAKVRDNQTSLVTSLRKGEIAIVKIGEKSVKVLMR